MTITEFLLARIAEDEAVAKEAVVPLAFEPMVPWKLVAGNPRNMAGAVMAEPARVLADCEAKRRIVEFHEAWPVLVEQPPTFERVESADPSELAMRASQRIGWMTHQEYRTRFGDEPPTTPMLAALAAIWADHPDYEESWRP